MSRQVNFDSQAGSSKLLLLYSWLIAYCFQIRFRWWQQHADERVDAEWSHSAAHRSVEESARLRSGLVVVLSFPFFCPFSLVV